MPVKSVRQVGDTGLWEVFNGGSLVYTDKNATFFVTGEMIEIGSKRNLSRARLEKLLVVPFASLPKTGALKITRGNGFRKLAVFADPRCSFCRKFEADLAKLDDVEISLYVLPVLGPESVAKSTAIWCSKEPVNAWHAFMLQSVEPAQAAANCDTPFKATTAFAVSVGIRGTPVTIFEDGTRLSGAASLDELQKRLDVASPRPVARVKSVDPLVQ